MKIIQLTSPDEIRNKFLEVDVDPRAVEMMLEKFQFLVIEVPEVRNVEANIIKQEMLVLGAEAALSRHSISCSVPTTTVLLAGTKKIFRRLIERIRPQVGNLPKIADELEKLLF